MISGTIPPQILVHDDTILSEVIRILKPGGIFIFQEAVLPLNTTPDAPIKTESWLKSHVKINGFIAADNVSENDFWFYQKDFKWSSDSPL